jgi:hypothetical protein
MAIPQTQRTDSPQTAKTTGDLEASHPKEKVAQTQSADAAPSWLPPFFRGTPSPCLSTSSLELKEDDTKPSVKFSNLVEVMYIPNLDDLSIDEKNAVYMTERDYELSSLSIENDVQCALIKKQNQQQQSTGDDPANDPSVHFALPQTRWIRYTFQQSSKTAVQLELQYQRRQQQQQYYGNVPFSNQWNDENIAAVYIPIAMKAQTMAYERAVLTAIETNQQLTISNPDAVA